MSFLFGQTPKGSPLVPPPSHSTECEWFKPSLLKGLKFLNKGIQGEVYLLDKDTVVKVPLKCTLDSVTEFEIQSKVYKTLQKYKFLGTDEIHVPEPYSFCIIEDKCAMSMERIHKPLPLYFKGAPQITIEKLTSLGCTQKEIHLMTKSMGKLFSLAVFGAEIYPKDVEFMLESGNKKVVILDYGMCKYLDFQDEKNSKYLTTNPSFILLKRVAIASEFIPEPRTNPLLFLFWLLGFLKFGLSICLKDKQDKVLFLAEMYRMFLKYLKYKYITSGDQSVKVDLKILSAVGLKIVLKDIEEFLVKPKSPKNILSVLLCSPSEEAESILSLSSFKQIVNLDYSQVLSAFQQMKEMV
jgi:hypothetical protein